MELPEKIKEIIELNKNRTYIVSEILNDEKTYDKVRNEIYDMLKAGFEIKELRTCPIHMKFNHDASKVYELELRHFYTYLCLWYPFIFIGDRNKLDESYFVNITNFTAKERKKYIDTKIIIPFVDTVDIHLLNMYIHDMLMLLARISYDFNIIMGISINMESFIDLASRNSEFKSILQTKVNPNDQPSVIEQEINEKTERCVDILKNNPNCLQSILSTGGVIKEKQLSEFMVSIGYRPDVDGNTTPIPINTNLLYGGLKNVSNYYLESLASRKSLLANKFDMGTAGYFSKMMAQLCSNYVISPDTKRCYTVKPIKIKLKTKKHVEMYNGRWYTTKNNPKLRMINATNDMDELLGKEIMVRSPITCACRNPYHICDTCYGNLVKINRNIGVGAQASITTSEPIGQNVLSVKHLLTTISEIIKFVGEFDSFLELQSNEIVLNNNIELPLTRLAVVLKREDIQKINSYDEDEYNIYVNKFYIRDLKTKKEWEIHEDNYKNLILTPELVSAIKSIYKRKADTVLEYEVPFSKIDSTTEDEDSDNEITRLFVISIKNQELTEPLNKIKSLLYSDKSRASNDINDITQTMIDLIITSHIDTPAVFAEIMLKPLVRSGDDILKYPNWGSYKSSENYKVTNVKTALEKNPSLFISLSSHALKRQLSNVNTFQKDMTSFLDELFRE